MKEFNGVITFGDYDIYAGKDRTWEAFLTDAITGCRENGGGRLTLYPGADIPIYARQDLEELWFVVSGEPEFSVWKDDGRQETRRLKKHHLVYLRKGQRHGVKNDGDSTAVLLVFFPQSGPELDFVKDNDVRVIPAINR